MKKFVAIVLMLLLAANVGGFSVTHHVCGKKSQYISFSGRKAVSKCCCSGGDVDKGCCKTKHAKIKLDEKQTIAKSLEFAKPLLLEALAPVPYLVVNTTTPQEVFATVQQLANPPPLLPPVRLHVLHGVFLI